MLKGVMKTNHAEVRKIVKQELISGPTSFVIDQWMEAKVNSMLNNKTFIEKLQIKLCK